MNTSKIIKGVVGGGRYTVTAPIIKEDYGLYLQIEGVELPDTYEVDFSNDEHSGSSVTMIGNADGVLIPSQFIKSGKDIFAFLYHVGVDYGRTIFKFKIPNKLRPDRTNEEPTPEEQSVIDQAISALNSAVTATAQAVIDADQSAQDSASSAQDSASSALSASDSAERASASATSASQSASQASASATASAQSASQSAQIKSDVEDLVDDAQGYAQASAQSATASANSASQASASATSASQSATSAQGYASQAQTSAQTASSKASEASGYASTASTKATESAQSASQALTYKTDAESAKTASQTAQWLAESARDNAITAKTDAESARDEAQDIVDGITGKVEQIDSNTDRIESLEDDRYKPYAVDSASGSVASFPDGADNIPLKSCIVQIEPVQDLHGYDHPWPAGGGKNLTPYNTPYVGTVDVNIQPTLFRLTLVGGKTYTFSCKQSATIPTSTRNTLGVRAVGSSVSYESTATNYNPANLRHSKTFTVENTGEYEFIIWSHTPSVSVTYTEWQVEEGSAFTSYTPYSNICPISGWTGMQLNANGTVIPISWQTEAGTVYGGKLDVLTGELVVDRAYTLLNNPDKWIETSDTADFRYDVGINDRKLYDNSYSGLTCSYVPCAYGAESYGRWSAAASYYFGIKSSTITLAQVKADASAGNIAIAYAIAQPITIQLTPNQVNSLLGVNNIWADSGDTEVVYRADTKLYIQKKIAEAISALS